MVGEETVNLRSARARWVRAVAKAKRLQLSEVERNHVEGATMMQNGWHVLGSDRRSHHDVCGQQKTRAMPEVEGVCGWQKPT